MADGAGGGAPDGDLPLKDTSWCYLNIPGYNQTLWRNYHGKRYHLTRQMYQNGEIVTVQLHEVLEVPPLDMPAWHHAHFVSKRLSGFSGSMTEADHWYDYTKDNFAAALMETLL